MYTRNPWADPYDPDTFDDQALISGSRNDAARMWRAYKMDPEGYVEQLYNRRICLVTGVVLG